ncbi:MULTISPECIES: acyl-CoA dehydrogenase family protein [Streptomycetaceae]|uniref:Acyl-CoA dehydrogenase n=1 Tax=Streptantibioticus cattleyicolor (strain ATCC 35852 / DSM 46488 / JCM 4925 / NBRC 14057 / NRRL 8057) TaxID=1003195 RepID=F8JZ62_STREN|nr:MULTISPECIES: acyl-CoA dehydrogenase family protein [Streptomycetaceae]AEW94728.1 acyl-CoA dehydrogenase [Streptantibioticus cattleyicolor NRRL 8057 = DSM 46488]MYS59359.1 acyl-CoA dehydrogenase [Streptomyces sp. SID5468]CCB75084.1 putative acyl-CoA dehydrogenase [Streptantibioticus cattleyicolor NRRL 8057 = DSM 46488]
MDFSFGPDDETFRAEARAWLDTHVPDAPPGGGPGWERRLGADGWIGLGWDTTHGAYGNRTASLTQQVVWGEEYARAGAPPRSGHIGENLLAPTLLAHGTPAQRDRFLPPVARGEELWCQGYSEPGAGSDLANVRTTAVLDGATYRITGQKIWTSLARDAHWCFLLARTRADTTRHHGLSFLLVPMDQPGRIEVRPIRQMTGTSDFNEVFFDGAHAAAEHRVGADGDGWRVAMSLLGFERGVSTLVQQIGFARELAGLVATAVATGTADDPVIRDRLVRQWAELRTMRWNALRTLGTTDPGAPSLSKLLWSQWHRRLGELALTVHGTPAATAGAPWSADTPYPIDPVHHLFLFSRADTIYGGTGEIQRNIIAERVLGLPREPRP